MVRSTSARGVGGVTTEDLRAAEDAYREIAERAEQAREYRNQTVRAALAAGWTHAKIAEATGLTRGRVGQIAAGSNSGNELR